MKTASGILTLILLLSGCAAVGPLAKLKGNPQEYEKKAKAALQELVQAWEYGDKDMLTMRDPKGLLPSHPGDVSSGSTLDVVAEAIWIGKDHLLIRASWQKFPQEATGFSAVRHMTNFIFSIKDPMTLQSIEGESPF